MSRSEKFELIKKAILQILEDGRCLDISALIDDVLDKINLAVYTGDIRSAALHLAEAGSIYISPDSLISINKDSVEDPYENRRTLANAWYMYRDLIQSVERFNIKDVGRFCWSDYTRDNVYQMEDIALDTISRCRDEQHKILKRYKELYGEDLEVI